MAENVFYLFVAQSINYILPFLSIPYLFRTLGAERYGIVASAYSFYLLMNIFINFGYDYTATKKIAKNIEDRSLLDEIVSETLLARFLLVIGIVLGSCVIYFVNNFWQNRVIFLSMLGIPIGSWGFSLWFFQGIQQMKFITVVTTATKLLSFVPMFFLVQKAEDDYVVGLCYSTGFVLSSFLSILIIKTTFKINIRLVDLSKVWFSIKESSSYCLARISANAYSTGTTVILNVVCGNLISGYYDVAIKIVNVFTQAMGPINQALYPYMVRNNDIALIKRIIFGSVLGCLIFFFCELLADPIFLVLFNTEETQVINTFRFLSFLLLFFVPSYLLGYPVLAARGYGNYVNSGVIIAAVIFLLVVIALYCLHSINIYTVTMAYLFSEFFVFISRIYGIKKYNVICCEKV